MDRGLSTVADLIADLRKKVVQDHRSDALLALDELEFALGIKSKAPGVEAARALVGPVVTPKITRKRGGKGR